MKTFKEFVNEATDEELSKEEMEKRVIEMGEKVLPNSSITTSAINLSGSENYSVFTVRLFNSKNEWKNGIAQNDPLSLSFSITKKRDGKYVIEYSQQSYSISPDDKYLAFGSHKLNLRKATTKDWKAMERKIQMMYKKVKDEGQKLLKDNKFDVHGEKQVKTIEKKLK